MAGDGESTKASRLRKRVEAESGSSSSSALKRAKNGSAFTKCEECNKDVAVALISFHNCSLDAKIKMNLEAQVVELPSGDKKKRAKQTEPKPKKERKSKDPKAPKRPPTAFFVFMESFRKIFKEANPDCKKVAMVAKEGGEKWKSMSDEDKKVYIDRAAELKAEYEKALESNNADNEEQDVDDLSEKAPESNEAENEEGVDGSSEKKVDEETEVDDE